MQVVERMQVGEINSIAWVMRIYKKIFVCVAIVQVHYEKARAILLRSQ